MELPPFGRNFIRSHTVRNFHQFSHSEKFVWSRLGSLQGKLVGCISGIGVLCLSLQEKNILEKLFCWGMEPNPNTPVHVEDSLELFLLIFKGLRGRNRNPTQTSSGSYHISEYKIKIYDTRILMYITYQNMIYWCGSSEGRAAKDLRICTQPMEINSSLGPSKMTKIKLFYLEAWCGLGYSKLVFPNLKHLPVWS